ncbi:hypothetical protein EIM48_11450 [Pseudoxanthomonas sp. SGNA-20]|uniref:hypothetical protein n=1 Tax=Pseudoxanthomonas sp. SGNA-20 TaxID=2493088 RepID=UPI000F6357D3|nr:hypothetical protein [Pseudoxanthomonas sp. SGNA-20]RRN55356.1 hypothetical protein EIM48_11450 [Pseudoxanthomonas sp. SGNA-20]
MAHVVRGCLERDFDASTGTCAHEIWIPQQSSLPALTVAEAQAIGIAFAFLWAVAFVFRRLRKFLDQA